MVAVPLSTISALEQEAMAGLLQLQTERVRSNSQSEPQSEPLKMKDADYIQTTAAATAAWVLSRCFTPKETSSPYNPASKDWVIEASEDYSSSTSAQSPKSHILMNKTKNCYIPSPTQTQQTVKHHEKNRKHFRKHVVHTSSRLSVCCFTHKSRKPHGHIRKVQTRDVATQTEESYDSSFSYNDACSNIDVKTAATDDNDATSRLERIIRMAMKRRQNISTGFALPALPVLPESATAAVSSRHLVPVPSAVPARPPALTLKAKISMLSEEAPSARLTKRAKSNEVYDSEVYEDSDDEWQPTESNGKSKQSRRRYTTSSSNKENMDVSELSEQYETEEEHHKTKPDHDLVPIGDGNAKVPVRLLKHMNWASYTNVTRKLLTAVFSRSVLATHSLTGKPSPAFPNKPAKKKLDPGLVNDIVQTVVERCGVPENVVRTSITTKCADESKMFRTRQRNKKTKHL